MLIFNSIYPLFAVPPPPDTPDPCLSRDCDQICTSIDGIIAECSCYAGFRLVDDVSCRDINECATNNGGCYHRCHNTEGDFYCSCKYGYELDYDGHACIYQQHPATESSYPRGPLSYSPSYPGGSSSYPRGPSSYSPSYPGGSSSYPRGPSSYSPSYPGGSSSYPRGPSLYSPSYPGGSSSYPRGPSSYSPSYPGGSSSYPSSPQVPAYSPGHGSPSYTPIRAPVYQQPSYQPGYHHSG